MIKVVVDTNVFVSSFFGGKPAEIIKLWSSGAIALCLSQDIICEYIEVLKRLGLQGQDELDELMKLFASGQSVLFSANPPNLSIVEDDPDDDKFLECAVGLNAKIIISGDKHLTKIGKYVDIVILKPSEFLRFYQDLEDQVVVQ